MSKNPLENLLASLKVLFQQGSTPFNIISELSKRPTDEHGNIWFGLDDADFTLWESGLKYLVPNGIFGPILIPTNAKVIESLLLQLKNGSAEGDFEGNASTKMITSLVGKQNVFASDNSDDHTRHKIRFKNWIANTEANIRKIFPMINAWGDSYFSANAIIDDDAIEALCASIMLSFLISSEAAKSEDLKKAIIKLKLYFTNKSMYKPADKVGYEAAKVVLQDSILQQSNNNPDSFPAHLLSQELSLDEINSHILSLMMVGFDNLQSAVQSSLIRLAEQSKQMPTFHVANYTEHNIPFVHLDKGPDQPFLNEALRLMPPVWAQTRKSKSTEQTVTYAGDKSFKLHGATLIIIPNFELARRHQNTAITFYPFSTGPNACPGRNIAFATLGLLLGKIISEKILLGLKDEPVLNAGVALKWQQVSICRLPCDNAKTYTELPRIPTTSSVSARFWSKAVTKLPTREHIASMTPYVFFILVAAYMTYPWLMFYLANPIPADDNAKDWNLASAP